MAAQYYRERRPHRSRRLFWLILLIIVILGLLVLVAHLMMLPFSKFSPPTRIAQVRVIQTHIPHRMDIELMILDSNGNQISDTHYPLTGDMWTLEGNIITCPEVLNPIGF